jgi:3-deoxy-7-phosphoheptulonate synthase
MLITMTEESSRRDLERILELVRDAGATAEVHHPRETVVSIQLGTTTLSGAALEAMPGVDKVIREGHSFYLASRKRQAEDTEIEIGGRSIGGTNPPVLIAGPCAVESRDQLFRCVEIVLEAGGEWLRGGGYKPRTSPYSFQGLGEHALELLAEARERFGIPLVSEMRDASTLDLFLKYEIDVIHIGARNMQNFEILKQAGISGRPIMLKRGPANSVDEWLAAAEYIMLQGNPNVILCERGITPPAGSRVRYMLDVASIPIVKSLSHLPVIADPSHAAGSRELVPYLASASVAAGAQGLLVEMHHEPNGALCDGSQALTPDMLRKMVADIRQHNYAIGRNGLGSPAVVQPLRRAK